MIYLLLSIVFSSSLFVIFKLFNRFEINNFQAIVVNYFVAFVVGILMSESSFQLNTLFNYRWIYGAVLLGILFITVFNMMALTAQKGGLSVASVAAKMSVIIPIIFGLLIYKESLSVFKLLGIVIALAAVYFTAYKKGAVTINSSLIILVLVLFLGSGILDTLLKYVETMYVNANELELYSATIFLIAGLIGTIVLIGRFFIYKEFIQMKSIIGGIVLGIPNYFSIFYLLKSLKHPTLESSTVFTINNMLIVCVTTLIGVVVFKENLSVRNKVGVLLSVIAIIMFSL